MSQLNTPASSQPTRVHPLPHSASANSFLRIPANSSAGTLSIPLSLQLPNSNRPPSSAGSSSDPPSPNSPSLSYSRNSASPAWFGASHYDQIDASFLRDKVDVPVSIEEEQKEGVFLRRKHRLGKAQYFVAPSSQGVEPTVHNQAPEERIEDGQNGNGTPRPVDDKEPTTPAAIGTSPATKRRSSSSNRLVKEEPPLPADTKPTPPGTDTSAKAAHQQGKLGQWPSTAICANDITSSCFYAISICVQSGGIWAPLCFLFVVGVLYLFRKVYGEAVTALPLNGGAYNVLLNTTSKKTAAFAACLSLLSYMATGVVSAASAISYLQFVAPGIPLAVGVIVILGFFAALTLYGISDSANVAYFIMVVHMSTIFVLAVTMIVFLCRHPHENQFVNNIHSGVNKSVPLALLYGYASAMLGVTGFETSSNFVEQQQEGVFVKTLRNMWIMVSVINPLLALLTVLILPLETIVSDQYMNVLLAYLGEYTGGAWLKYWVVVDAFLVLAAAVLTAYVGMTGLARRLSLDRGLPQVLLRVNRWRHTNHWIILSFLVICIVLYFIVNGNVNSLGNVYSISFLLVMSCFACGNMLLKYNRGQLKREVTASWLTVLSALVLVLLALAGVIAKDPSILVVWVIFFIVVITLVGLMFFRIQLLHLLYHIVRHMSAKLGYGDDNRLLRYIKVQAEHFSNQSAIFFTKYGRLPKLNQAILYLLDNEEASHLYIVHIYSREDDIPSKLLRHVSVLDSEYDELTVELVLVRGQFDGETIDWLSEQLNTPKNMCFLTAPHQDFKVKLASLGGVRLITR